MIHHFSVSCVKNALQFPFERTKKTETQVSAFIYLLFVSFDQTISAIVTFVYDAGSVCF